MDGNITNNLAHLIPPALNVPSEEVVQGIIDSKIKVDPARLSETHSANTIYRTLVVPAVQEHKDLRELAIKQLEADEKHRQGQLDKVNAEIAETEVAINVIEEGEKAADGTVIKKGLMQLRNEFHNSASAAGLDVEDGESPAAVNAAVRKTLRFETDKKPNAIGLFLLKIMENAGVPLIVLACGTILGVTFGTETSFFSFSDLEDGLDFSVRTMILFIIGPAIVLATGELLALTVRISHRSKESRELANFLIVVSGLVWLAEVLIEAFGFQDLYFQHTASLQRVGIRLADRPFLIFLIFGFIASSPYFGYKIAKQKAALQDQEKADGKAAKRLEEEDYIRKFFLGSPAAQRALDLSGEIQDRLAEYGQLKDELARLMAKKATLSELSKLSEDLRRRLEAAEKQAKDGMTRFCELTGTCFQISPEPAKKKETKPLWGAKVSRN